RQHRTAGVQVVGRAVRPGHRLLQRPGVRGRQPDALLRGLLLLPGRDQLTGWGALRAACRAAHHRTSPPAITGRALARMAIATLLASATAPMRNGERASPSAWRARLDRPTAKARELGETELTMAALSGAVFMNSNTMAMNAMA